MPNYANTKKPFRPVRCKESDLETLAPIEGYVLFTTDTNKIYVCVDGEYKMMGGSSGIFYGTRTLTDDEKYGDALILVFTRDQIEGKQNPNVDDLILNIPDGGFYRITDVDEDNITATKIAVSGSGSGGGGGGADTNQGSVQINLITPATSSVIAGKDYYIEFEVVAKDSAGDLVLNDGIGTWRINGKEVGTQVIKNGENRFKVDEYLDSTKETNKIILVLSMDTGGATNTIISKTWNVSAVELSLKWEWDYSFNNYINTDTYRIQFYPFGRVNCTAHYRADDGSYITQDLAARDVNGSVFNSITMKSLSYGAHTLEVWLSAEINGESFETDHIKNELTFIQGADEGVILTVPYYQSTAMQYESLNIPFLVYDPKNTEVEVTFKVNGNIETTASYNRELHYWPYSIKEVGVQTLEIDAGAGASKLFEIAVTPLDLDVEEDKDYVFSLKAADFSGNSQIQDWSSTSGVGLSFSDNFDWERGGLQTETLSDGSTQKYICVRQGTTMTINHKLFGSEPKDGLTFKFCFKTANVYDYEAQVLSCYSESDKIGLRMTAQEAILSTPSHPSFSTQYYENTYLELEAEIWKNVADSNGLPGDRFIMFWLDGVPVGVKAYPTNENFVQTSKKQDIVIGSDLCDVYVYLVKAYNYRLTENQHINNFIMDAPNSNEMIARYNRNNILDNVGEISYEKLVQQNPGCRAYVYEMDHMTTSKSDKVDKCKYFELYGNYNTEDNPYYQTDNAQVYVQGTSSAAYGVAAFNLRTKFKNLINANGEAADGWKPNETALPIDLACTKVNIASCENANNAVNVDWYNKFQPYHDSHRRKGSQYRDCMEFNTGVVFVKDNNPTTEYYNSEGKPDKAEYLKANAFLDTSGYANKPYYKMYAIGNMGNDKKNANIFHDTDNPKVCCLEVRDNQNDTHWMTTPITLNTVDEKDVEGNFVNYEFRYPDGNDKASTKQKQAWVDFVNWMAQNNPRGATNKPLKAIEVSVSADSYKANYYFLKNDEGQYYKDNSGIYNAEVTYYDLTTGTEADADTTKAIFDNYTFKGFEPPEAPVDPDPSGISLKGTVVTDYSTTKVVKQMKLDSNGDPVVEGDEESGYEYVWEEVTSIVPYTTDSYEYRMARMLSECEDHMVMDSIVYHYLFVERHTMVDNIAKNAFWSTEDLIHWDLTRNYDNDTLDGNDNSGFLTFSYGIEVYDKKKSADGTEGDAVFNAENSVWLAFINGLPEARSSLYKKLQTKGAWNAKEYLAEFNKVQSIIPERCWIADYIRKYIRPRRLGLDVEGSYLERLEGGKKVAQRTQYETYNEYYQNSKYIAGAQFTPSSAIDMRLNMGSSGTWDSEHAIPITYYIDCYGSGLFGGRATQSGRLKRGEVYECPIGELLSNPHDATSYIYGANMIQTLGGIAEVYPSYAVFSSASKLREIELGSDENNYRNNYLKTVGINANEMLQKALLQNVGHPDGLSNELDLTKAVQLTELRLNGSTAKTLTLADGGIIETLYLNGLTTLIIKNLNRLKDVQVDEDIYENMSYLTVENCPGFDNISYQLALKAPLKKYTITDFSWKITEANEENFDIQEGKVVGIKVLDNLAKLSMNKTDLAGTIIIDVNCSIDEYTIYEKYVKIFPNVVFEYTDKVDGLVSAIELKFLTEKNGNELYYRVLADSNNEKSLAVLTSSEGPTGLALTKPSDKITLVSTQKFNGYWIDESGKKYYRVEDMGVEPESDAIDFATFVPKKNYSFYPDVTSYTTKHAIKFYNLNDEVIQTDMIPYGSKYSGSMINYLYADDSKLKENERYGFKGWTITKYEIGKGKKAEFVDLENYIVKGPISLYPYYEIEDITKISTNPSYFETFEIKESSGITRLGVRLKSGIPLQGKITVPNPEEIDSKYDSKKLAEFDYIRYDFVNQTDVKNKITVFYFKSNAPYTEFAHTDGSSFATKMTALKRIEFPSGLKVINSDRVFEGCTSLVVKSLPETLTEINTGAFSGCSNVALTSLPPSLTLLGTSAFQTCTKLAVEKFDTKQKDNGTFTLSSFGTYVFAQAGREVSSVYITDNFIDAIRDKNPASGFSGYGNNDTVFYFEGSNSADYEVIIGTLGLSGRHCVYGNEV